MKGSLHKGQFLAVILALLTLFVYACSSDDDNVFSSSRIKAYVSSVNIGSANCSAPSFDQGIFDYVVSTTGKPTSCELTITAQNQESITCNSVTQIGSMTTTITLSTVSNTVVTILASKDNAQSTTYKITFRMNEQNTDLAYLRPYSGTSKSYLFTRPYSVSRSSYFCEFYDTATLGMEAATVNPSAQLFFNGNPVSASGAYATYSFPSNLTLTNTVKVISPDGSVTNTWNVVLNRVVFSFYGPFIEYTTDAYGFTGGIKTIRDKTMLATSAPYQYEVPVGERQVTGIFTGRLPGASFKVATVSGSVAQEKHYECFFIEDDEAGIMVVTEAPGNADDFSYLAIGDKVTLNVIRTIRSYTMPVAVINPASDTIKVVGKAAKIHYQTGDFSVEEARGRVYKLSGVPTGVQSYGELGFNCATGTAGSGMFHLLLTMYDDWKLLTLDSLTHHYYGPVLYTYSKNELVISEPGQIHYTDDVQ